LFYPWHIFAESFYSVIAANFCAPKRWAQARSARRIRRTGHNAREENYFWRRGDCTARSIKPRG
jgi:hypothetical protein